MFKGLRSLSCRGNEVNEDFVFASEGLIMVLDGSSGLGGATAMEEWGSDACWFSHRVGTRVAETLRPQDTVDACLTGILPALKAEMDDRCREKGLPPARPSACITLLRDVGVGLEYYALGDCTALLERPDGTVERLRDPAVPTLDGAVVTRLRALIPTVGVAAAQAQVRPLLQKNRRRMNQPDGYGVLELSGGGLPLARRRAIPYGAVTRVCLLSDGFADLFDTFHAVPTAEDFFRLIAQNPLQGLVDDLFSRQGADPMLLDYPRLKLRDDTSAVYGEVAEQS